MFRGIQVAVAPPAESGGPLDLINGLPVHPLVVHAAVVLVPLTAIGVIVMALWPRFSQRHGWLVVGTSLVALGANFMAKESGEGLEERVGEPGFDHAELGNIMPVFAAALAVVVVVLWLIDRRAPVEGPAPRRALRIVVAIAAVLIAVANIFWVYRVGDSGAKSVWTGKIASSTVPTGSADGDD
jgi:hypothetical protein